MNVARRSAFGVRRILAAAALALLLAPHPARAQSRLRTQQEQLDKLRQERAALEQRMVELRGTVHDLNEEVTNLDRQADATARVVKVLDGQLSTINHLIDSVSANVSSKELELEAREAMLRERLVEIYKRGPLYSVEVMLSAQSFGELVARYKYLHQLARHDRQMVTDVRQLRDSIDAQRRSLVQLRRSLEYNRQDKTTEEERLRGLMQQRSTSLVQTRRAAAHTEQRLAAVKRDQERLTRLIDAAIEAERRRVAADAAKAAKAAEAAKRRGDTRAVAAAPKAASSIRTSDIGRLAWPVEGRFLYDFGREQRANNTQIRWNGIGIEAAEGTPVRVVASGKVLEVGRFGTYGLTVIVEHGGGDYSIYGSLGSASVAKGATVSEGQQIGTVGISDPEMGPHLHFEIRHGGPAVDPKLWLRTRR